MRVLLGCFAASRVLSRPLIMDSEDSSKCFYYLLLILFLLPLPLGANIPWAWSLFEIAICTLTIWVVIKNWKRNNFGFTSYKSSVYLWMALLVVCIVQIIPLPATLVNILSPTSFELFQMVSAQRFTIAIDPGLTFISVIKVFSFFCLFVCIVCLIDTEKRIRQLLMTIMAAGTFQALYGTLEMTFGGATSLVFDLALSDAATGTFTYSNHYANFVMMGLAALVGLWVMMLEQTGAKSSKKTEQTTSEGSLLEKRAIIACVIIMVIGLFMSGSRMGITAFFLALVLVGAIALILFQKSSKGLRLFVINMALVDLFIVSAYFGVEQIKDRLSPPEFEAATRSDIVRDAYPIIADFPILGSGGGSFYSTFPSYQHVEIGLFYDNLHNDYLQFLIEYGIVGSFILFAIFALCVYKALEAMFTRRNFIHKGAAYACLLVFMAMAPHMSADYPLQAYACCYFVVFLALSVVINHAKRKQQALRSRTGQR